MFLKEKRNYHEATHDGAIGVNEIIYRTALYA